MPLLLPVLRAVLLLLLLLPQPSHSVQLRPVLCLSLS
jgi:hypothetical protein